MTDQEYIARMTDPAFSRGGTYLIGPDLAEAFINIDGETIILGRGTCDETARMYDKAHALHYAPKE